MKRNNSQAFAFILPSWVILLVFVALFSSFVFYGYSDWVFTGGVWAESATNYFSLSRSDSWYQRLFGTDAGYIPLPQRLIALFFAVINLPIVYIPIAYFASATLISAFLVGIFTLPRFRVLVNSDFLRFLISSSVFLFADFEQRQFINFTIFSLFFVLVVSALSAVDFESDLPWWAWLVPVLMISKPHLLTAVPLLIFCLFFCRSNFRLISFASLLVAAIQLVQMAFSHASGHFEAANSYGLIDRALAAFYYFVALIGVYIAGLSHFSGWVSALFYGAVFLFACIFSWKFASPAIRRLILFAVAIALTNAVMNSFLLSDSWNIGLDRLSDAFSHRQVFIQYASTVVLLGCMLSVISGRVIENAITSSIIQTSLFICWFFFAGWAGFVVSLNTLPSPPTIGNSYWISGVKDISNGSKVCIPIDPIGWSYGPGCIQLNSEISWGRQYFFARPLSHSGDESISYYPPPFNSNANLSAVSILLRSKLGDEINACLEIFTKDSGKVRDCKKFTPSQAGGLLTFTPRDGVNYADIVMLKFEFSSEVEVAYVKRDENDIPAILVYVLRSED